jgi:hypothetical protein
METHAISLQGAVLAALLCVTPVHAEMYKWIGEDGTVTYSNTPPTERGKVKDVTKMDNINTVAADKRPKAVQAPALDRAGALKPDTAFAPESVIRPDPVAGTPDTTTRREAGTTPAPRVTLGGGIQTEAVQDPCLRSSDPQCHERNKDKYHPYLGYAPSATRSAVGASSSAAGGGAVGGQVNIVPSAAAAEKRPTPPMRVAPPIEVKTK